MYPSVDSGYLGTGTCVEGGFKGGGFQQYVIASCVCVITVLFAMLISTSYSILKPPPMKQPPAQVPKKRRGMGGTFICGIY